MRLGFGFVDPDFPWPAKRTLIVQIVDSGGDAFGPDPDLIQIEQGASVQLTARLQDSSGTIHVPVLADITWEVQGAPVGVTVDANGLVAVDGAVAVGSLGFVRATWLPPDPATPGYGSFDPVEIEVVAPAGTPGGTYYFVLSAGDGQVGDVNGVLPGELRAKVFLVADDSFVSGLAIVWTASGDASFQSTTNVTGGVGGTLATAILGSVAGTYTFRATAPDGSFVEFTAEANAVSPYTLSIISGNLQSGPPDEELTDPVVIEITQGGSPAAGIGVSLTPGSTGSVVADGATDANGRISIAWTLGNALGGQSLAIDVPSLGLTAEAFATATPPGTTTNLTPASQLVLIGPTIERAITPPGWPTSLEGHIDAAVARYPSEIAINDYDFIPDSAIKDSPHYAPLRFVHYRNLRAGKATNASDPEYAAVERLTEETLVRYFDANDHAVSLNSRYTSWCDFELYWLNHKDDPPGIAPQAPHASVQAFDTKQLAAICVEHMHTAANWSTWFFNATTRNIHHAWMEGRAISVAMDMAMSCDRMGVPWNQSINSQPVNSYVKNNGATSWQTFATTFLNAFIDDLQAQMFAEFGALTDPNGLAILEGDLRQKEQVSGNFGPAPYAIHFFMQAMLIESLLRSNREYAYSPAVANAVELTASFQQHYLASNHCLAYFSHARPGGPRYYNSPTDWIIQPFYPRALYEMYLLDTGSRGWMRDMALDMLTGPAAHRGNWTWSWKQAQQLGSTGIQSLHALLGGQVP